MHQPLKKLILTLSLPFLAAPMATLRAQSLVPSSAPEFVYNGVYPFETATSTTNYSLPNIPTGFGDIDLYLSDGGSPIARQFVYQFSHPGDPSAIVYQGSFLYMDVVDMQVGAVWNSYTNNMNLLVAYAWGHDHYLDIYDLTSSTTNPVVLKSSTQLSHNTADYGRIRMDCHKQYGVAIVWENKGIGLQTMMGNGGAWGPIVTLTGTELATGPDVAFSHSGNDLNVHYAYYDPKLSAIVESAAHWTSLMTGPASATLSLEDINVIGGAPKSRIILDCPDHHPQENWAYTYSDGSNIFVRLREYNTLPAPVTVSVNSGVLGNASTLPQHQVFSPALYYGAGTVDGRSGQITVGWYATDLSGFNGYIALEMTEDGTTLLSKPDYLALPDAYTPQVYPYYSYPYQADILAIKPGIAFSRNSEHANFLYTTYYDANAQTAQGRFHHAFHKWNDVAFKGQAPVTLHPECGNHLKAHSSETGINTYPNPFRDKITTNLFLKEDGQLLQSLTDITGRQLWQYQTIGKKGSCQISTDNLAQLAPGTYMLTTSLNGQRIGTQKVTKQ
ncbi:T9SS type A sorting domain-containing protein [Taibaiella koreensis]|uniref:T9SS type A sorting domain-containing protein n=1 Tax=Taibaiella koreensis TaxID=1268548 RepID=UPI000E5A0351|nr:T9SS type A sorting domain-containing protein [Taibaiella koreensis]